MPVPLFSMALHFDLVYSDRCLNCVWQSCSESEQSISVRVRVRLKGAVSTNSNWFLKGFAGLVAWILFSGRKGGRCAVRVPKCHGFFVYTHAEHLEEHLDFHF